MACRIRAGEVNRVMVELAKDSTDDTNGDHGEDCGDKEVRRQSEDLPGLADSPQVAVKEQNHHTDGDQHLVRSQYWECRGHRVGAGGGLDRDGHDVVDD